MTTPHLSEPAGAPESPGAGGLVRLRLDIAYDGSGFHGWARQPGLRSVQGELEGSLRAVLRVPASVPVRVAVAGRTDTGVHATGQVCHCDAPEVAWRLASAGRCGELPADSAVGADIVLRRLNGLLAPDLRVRRLGVAAEGFDARWSALWRRYEYLVASDPVVLDPRTRGHVLWHPRSLDVAAMSAAATPFLGEHDFAAFCRARPDASSVRTIQQIGWSRADSGPIRFTIRADAFCHSMVRSLVGAFLAVGDGRWPVDRPAELLAAGIRVPSIATAPAHGLTLVEVGYPVDSDLAAQAGRARRWRGR